MERTILNEMDGDSLMHHWTGTVTTKHKYLVKASPMTITASLHFLCLKQIFSPILRIPCKLNGFYNISHHWYETRITLHLQQTCIHVKCSCQLKVKHLIPAKILTPYWKTKSSHACLVKITRFALLTQRLAKYPIKTHTAVNKWSIKQTLQQNKTVHNNKNSKPKQPLKQ